MKVFQTVFALAFMLILGSSALAQSNVFVNEKNVAINGYDVVAYFNAHDAVRGNIDHKVSHSGTDYYFSSAENASTFKTNPENYLPAYGGYCAFAVGAKSTKFPTDPETFKIRDGKLYLFYNDYYEGKPFNTIIPWNANEADLIEKADKNWTSLK